MKPAACERAVKQFDIVANPFPRSRERQPFLVALQSDLVRSLDTVVVAPLEPAASGTFADRLNPRVDVEGQPFVLLAQELVTVRKSVLGTPRGSIAGAREAIIAALDLLFTGF
jgi:toxin CcdB